MACANWTANVMAGTGADGRHTDGVRGASHTRMQAVQLADKVVSNGCAMAVGGDGRLEADAVLWSRSGLSGRHSRGLIHRDSVGLKHLSWLLHFCPHLRMRMSEHALKLYPRTAIHCTLFFYPFNMPLIFATTLSNTRANAFSIVGMHSRSFSCAAASLKVIIVLSIYIFKNNGFSCLQLHRSLTSSTIQTTTLTGTDKQSPLCPCRPEQRISL